MSDSATTPTQAAQVLATFANRNGWPVEQADRWVEAIEDAHTFLIGWDENDLYALAQSIAASKLPKSRDASLYVLSLTGSNVQGVTEQTAQSAAATITSTAKAASKPTTYLPILALAAGAAFYLTKSDR